PRDAEELHDALLGLVVLRPEQEWEPWFHELARDCRAARVDTPGGPFWLATERRALVEALFPGAPIDPAVRVPAMRGREDGAADPETAAVEAARGHLAAVGPATAGELAVRTGLGEAALEQALARLEAEGFALRGRFDPDRSPGGAVEFCERRLLARIHRYTTDRL